MRLKGGELQFALTPVRGIPSPGPGALFLKPRSGVLTGGGNKKPRLSGALLKRMKRLEPSTFCMAKAGERSHPFA